MAIKANFDMAAIRKASEVRLAQMEQLIIEELVYLGEECVNYARSVPAEVGFTDVTGNLRSSIGYVIFQDGKKILDSGFEKVVGPKASTEPSDDDIDGTVEGLNQAVSIAGEYQGSFVLVVVAGMSYAAAVESRGKDVLTGATRLAEEKFPEMMRQLINNLPKK